MFQNKKKDNSFAYLLIWVTMVLLVLTPSMSMLTNSATNILLDDNSDSIITLNSSSQFENNTIIINPIFSVSGQNYGNWTWAESQPWCFGSGSFEEPYIIENITFSASAGMSCLEIADSVDVYVTIRNCTFSNEDRIQDLGYGLSVEKSSNITVYNCTFYSNYVGAYFYGQEMGSCENNTIRDCVFNSNYLHGIHINKNGHWNNISNNQIIDMQGNFYSGSAAIYLQNNCCNNTINNNELIAGNRTGIFLELDCCWNNVTYNLVDDYVYGVNIYQISNFNNFNNNTILNCGFRDTHSGSLIVNSGSSYNNFTNNFCSGSESAGITLTGSGVTHNRVFHNTIRNIQDRGIYLYSAIESMIENNSISECQYGIQLYQYVLAANNYVSNNSITDCTNYGIDSGSNANTFAYNYIDGCPLGIRITESDVINNTIKDCLTGIFSLDCSMGIIENNSVEATQYGIRIQDSENLKIHQNKIVGCQLADILTTGWNNINFTSNILDQRGFLFEKDDEMEDLYLDSSNIVRNNPILVREDEIFVAYDGNLESSLTQTFIFGCNNVEIQNFVLNDYAAACMFMDCDIVDVSDSDFSGVGENGINAFNVSEIWIQNCNITSVEHAIVLYDCNTTQIVENNVSETTGTAIGLFGLSNGEINDNILSNGDSGIYLEINVPDFIINPGGDDLGANTPVYYPENAETINSITGVSITGNTFYNIDQDALTVQGGEHFVFSENSLDLVGEGLALTAISNVVIQNNDISNLDETAIYCEYVDHMSIMGNLIEHTGANGLELLDVYNSTIQDNLFNDCDSAIYVDADEISFNITIQGNSINGSRDVACEINNLNNSTITSNILNNSDTGILVSNGDYLGFEYNHILNSALGVYAINDVSNSYLTSNSFIGNTLHAQDDVGINWSLNGVGNYWDNYTGSDADGNGIGDTPYEFIIGATGAVDAYPLLPTVPIFISQPLFMGGNEIEDLSTSFRWIINDNTDISSGDRTYTIMIDGVEVESGIWVSNSPIVYNLDSVDKDNFSTGSHQISIMVSDADGNSIDHSVTFVYAPADDGEDPNNGWWIALIIIASIVAASTAGMYILKKKDPTRYDELMSRLMKFIEKAKQKIEKMYRKISKKLKKTAERDIEEISEESEGNQEEKGLKSEKPDEEINTANDDVKDASEKPPKAKNLKSNEKEDENDSEEDSVDVDDSADEVESSNEEISADKDDSIDGDRSADIEEYSPENPKWQEKFKAETGKNAVYRGNITKGFINWLEKQKK